MPSDVVVVVDLKNDKNTISSSTSLNATTPTRRNMADQRQQSKDGENERRKSRAGVAKPYYGLTKLLVMKVALPHVGLLTLIIVYTIIGAFIFKHLEQNEFRQSVINANDTLIEEKWQFLNRVQSIIYEGNGSRTDAVDAVQEFIEKLHKIYRSPGGRYVDKPVIYDHWTFDKALFFGATTLASIGYGAQAPTTWYGRLFCIIFAVFGLPLAVIMIADLAKFISRFVVWCYTQWLMYKHNLTQTFLTWCRRNVRVNSSDRDKQDDEKNGEQVEEVAEFLWTNLENAQFVQVPGILMFTLILIYVTIGAVMFIPMEHWTFTEGFYFSIVSILVIGFGDFTPKNDKFTYVALLYVLFGVLLATTCIDVVGLQYVNNIHNFGRRLTKTDPLIWLKAVQERRLRRMKKQAMMALFNTVAVLNRMKLDGPERALELSTGGNSVEANLALMNDIGKSKDPPSEPMNFKAESVSVFSVILRWDPPTSGSTEDLHYLLSYRLSPLSTNPAMLLIDAAPFEWTIHGYSHKPVTFNIIRHAPRKTAMTVVEPIYDCTFEVASLRSFSLYHFSLVAANKYGRSGPVYTQEYTEPSSVPLNLRADQITDSSVTVCWDSPVKNKNGERQYTVHYTPDFDRPIEEWCRDDCGDTKIFTAKELKPNTRYAFTVSANHNGKLAIFSRSLQILTKSMSSLKKISVAFDGQTARVNSNPVVAFEIESETTK